MRLHHVLALLPALGPALAAVPSAAPAQPHEQLEIDNLAPYQGLRGAALIDALPGNRSWVIRRAASGTLLSIRDVALELPEPASATRRLMERVTGSVECSGRYLDQVSINTAIVYLGRWCSRHGIPANNGDGQVSSDAAAAVCNYSPNQQMCSEQETWDAWAGRGIICGPLQTGWWYAHDWAKGYSFDTLEFEHDMCYGLHW